MAVRRSGAAVADRAQSIRGTGVRRLSTRIRGRCRGHAGTARAERRDAWAFAKPALFIGKAIEIAGDELTNPQIAATFGRVMGRPVKFRRLPLFLTRILLGKEFHQMFKWFNESGFQAEIPSLRRDYPEMAWTSLEEWLTREGWAGKKSYARHAKTFDARIPKAA